MKREEKTNTVIARMHVAFLCPECDYMLASEYDHKRKLELLYCKSPKCKYYLKRFRRPDLPIELELDDGE
jgi:hypothetical protein